MNRQFGTGWTTSAKASLPWSFASPANGECKCQRRGLASGALGHFERAEPATCSPPSHWLRSRCKSSSAAERLGFCPCCLAAVRGVSRNAAFVAPVRFTSYEPLRSHASNRQKICRFASVTVGIHIRRSQGAQYHGTLPHMHHRDQRPHVGHLCVTAVGSGSCEWIQHPPFDWHARQSFGSRARTLAMPASIASCSGDTATGSAGSGVDGSAAFSLLALRLAALARPALAADRRRSVRANRSASDVAGLEVNGLFIDLYVDNSRRCLRGLPPSRRR